MTRQTLGATLLALTANSATAATTYTGHIASARQHECHHLNGKQYDCFSTGSYAFPKAFTIVAQGNGMVISIADFAPAFGDTRQFSTPNDTRQTYPGGRFSDVGHASVTYALGGINGLGGSESTDVYVSAAAVGSTNLLGSFTYTYTVNEGDGVTYSDTFVFTLSGPGSVIVGAKP